MKPGAASGASSVESNSRPRRIGIRRVLKYPEVTTRIVAEGKSPGVAGHGCPEAVEACATTRTADDGQTVSGTGGLNAWHRSQVAQHTSEELRYSRWRVTRVG